MSVRSAMILTAGFGTRMAPFDTYYAKPVLPVVGLAMLERIIVTLRDQGVERVVLNLHHQGQQIRDFLGDGRDLGLTLRYLYEEHILGTGGGLRNASALLAGETFLLVNGDILFELDLPLLEREHLASGAAITLVVRKDPQMQCYGTLRLDSGHRVVGFLGHGIPDGEPFMFTGIHLLEASVLDALPPGPSCIVRDFYLPHFEELSIHAHVLPEDHWFDLGTASRWFRLNLELLQKGRFLPPATRAAHDARQHALVVHPTELPLGVSLQDCIIGRGVRFCGPALFERVLVLDHTVVHPAEYRDGVLCPHGWFPTSNFHA